MIWFLIGVCTGYGLPVSLEAEGSSLTFGLVPLPVKVQSLGGEKSQPMIGLSWAKQLISKVLLISMFSASIWVFVVRQPVLGLISK
jgi:hypothetical protein